MISQSSLPAILAFARAGAVDHAWALLSARTAGQEPDDPATLNIMGRLLKEKAGREQGDEQRRLYREAAAAYRRSAQLEPATYPLINAASVSLMAGEGRQAAALAAEVLQALEAAPDEPETPYWLAATRSEALLLLSREAEARAALAEATRLAPRAWEDQATTLRQFRLILRAQGKDAGWLDSFRPPRSLHFAGHMSFDSNIFDREPLDDRIARLIEEENIGFSYGALAAGADIIIAEAMLAGGAELHAILPGGPEAFAAVSVDPFGESWRRRFEALLEQAETVRTIRPAGMLPGIPTIAVADEVAMGVAVLNARRLESEAIQLLVVDECGVESSGVTGRASEIWKQGKGRQELVRAPREATEAIKVGDGLAGDPQQPLAVIAIMIGEASEARGLERALDTLRSAISEAAEPFVPPYWTGQCVLLAQPRLRDAADQARSLARKGYRVGGDYVAAAAIHDPFSNEPRLEPVFSSAAAAAAASTPAGSACITEEFAAALAARGTDDIRCDYVGELSAPDGGQPIPLYALR